MRLRHLGTYSHSLAAGTVIDQMMRLYIDSQLDPRWLFEQNFSVILIMSDIMGGGLQNHVAQAPPAWPAN